ncbi:hypothetical protein POTOM_036328 [Populus tomentosa]|uniref:Uncharacterized protein n=1 Tax=Populus tomentosa TaxID=118781 RepID=A0A8X7ZAG4_POPTO|nr:hypothetical protein POTOM_036328 [Populus tomentosa]
MNKSTLITHVTPFPNNTCKQVDSLLDECAFMIQHRSLFLPPRQVDGTTDSWKLLFPDAAASFSLKSLKYNIDEILEHQPNHAVGRHPARALRVTLILKGGKMNIVRISDWMPENEPSSITGRRGSNHHHHNLLEMSPHNSSCYPPQAVNFMQFLSLLGLEHLFLNTHRGDFIPVGPESSFSIFY